MHQIGVGLLLKTLLSHIEDVRVPPVLQIVVGSFLVKKKNGNFASEEPFWRFFIKVWRV